MEQMAGAREGRKAGLGSFFVLIRFGFMFTFSIFTRAASGHPTEAREAVRLQSLEVEIAGLEARLHALRKGIYIERIQLSMVPFSFAQTYTPFSETAHLEHVTTRRQHEEERLAHQREDIFSFAERMVSCAVTGQHNQPSVQC
jgi:hypothetical protein